MKCLTFIWTKLRSEDAFEGAGLAWAVADEFVFEVKGKRRCIRRNCSHKIIVILNRE
jgi:hypothetical protein